MHTIFDIGLYDGTDTAYYLSLGSRVIAVEANPLLVARGQKRLAAEIASGRLTIVHAAISTDTAPVTRWRDWQARSSCLPHYHIHAALD